MTMAGPQVLEAWSEVFSSPVITELAPGRLWEVATERGDRYVLKKVSAFGARPTTGKACATDVDGALHAMFPMLPKGGADDDPGLDPVLFRNVGAAIARLHVALAGCPFGVDSWVVGPGLLSAWWQTVQDRLPAAAVTELSARIRPRWDSIVQALSAAPQRVHGDVHGGNLLTDGQEVTGIIDCDHLPLAPRGYDLGYYLAFGVHWRLAGNQPSQPADEAVPFIARHLLTGYDAVSRLTRQENDDLPALALAAALGLIDYFVREHDLVEENWLRTAHWIGDNFDALRLPASVPWVE